MNETCIETLIVLKNTLITSKNSLLHEEINEPELIEQILHLINIVETKVKAECKHDYVEDYIDVDPERSMRITYCNKCLSQFQTE
jgi:hypothetical protein